MSLHPRTLELLQMYPPMFRRDPTIMGILDVDARELDRLESAIQEAIDASTPTNASERYLPYWEGLFGLPINPTDRTVSQRRSLLQAYMRRIKGGGQNWEDRVTDLIGPSWSYTVFNPEDLSGLWWDRYSVTDDLSQWIATAEISVGDGGIRNTDQETILTHRSTLRPFQNYLGMIRFEVTPDEVAASVGQGNHELGVILKYEDGLNVGLNTALMAEIYDGQELRIWCNGAELEDTAIDLSAGGTFWLVGVVDGDDVTAAIYDTDPSKPPGQTPIYSITTTLTGGDATSYGASVLGPRGVYYGLSNWLITDTKGAQANVDVDDFKVRVVLPFAPNSTQEVIVRQLIKTIMPANMEIEVTSDEYFVLGESELGYQTL